MIEPELPLEVISTDLSDQEQEVAAKLSWRITQAWPFLEERELYYDGEQRMRNLGIAVPPELEHLRTAAGWPGVVVDTIDERLDVAGFRIGDSPNADQQMWDIWTQNRMDNEAGLAHLDALLFGRGFVMVGTRADGSPLITVESPQNMAADFDGATHQVKAALQQYRFWGMQAANLYLPNETVRLLRHKGGSWKVDNRDQHNLGRCPVVMLANRARSNDRYGRSEITPEVMSWTDAACRTLLGMEISREFFAAPQRYILGATEEAFQDTDGNPLNAWETYVGRVLALERDEEGNLPTVGSFQATDPAAYVTIMQGYTRLVSSRTGVPQHLLGWSADNPTSADSVQATEGALNRRAKRRMHAFGPEWAQVMELALTVENNGQPLPDVHMIETLWAPAETPTPLTTSQAILAQVQMGALPPTSDVTLEKLGYTAAERLRIAADRAREAAKTNLDAIADALSSGSLAKELGADAGNADPQGAAVTAQANAPEPVPAGH